MITSALAIMSLHRKLPLPPLGRPRKAPVAALLAPGGRGFALERDGYACVCCGRSIIGKRYRLRPRKPGKAGEAAPENLITLLAWHASHADPVTGYRLSAQQDPLLVPVRYALPAGPTWFWLTPDGKRTTFPPAGALRQMPRFLLRPLLEGASVPRPRMACG
jgi:hypothetical protein